MTGFSAEGPLPFPRDRLSWLVGAILFLVLMGFYYGIHYGRLETAYREGFIYTSDTLPEIDANRPRVHIALPRYLSSMTDRPIFVSVTNPTEEPVTVTIILKVVISTDPNDPARDDSAHFVFLTATDGAGNTLQDGVLTFEDVPPLATISRQATLKVVGSQSPGSQVDLLFDIIMPDGAREELKPDDAVTMEVDSVRTLMQNLVAFVLLPPWANGFIPLFALFAVYLFGMAEARGKWRYRKPWLWLWLLLLFIWANLVVWTAVELAVSVLYERTGLSLLAGGLLVSASLIASYFGHKHLSDAAEGTMAQPFSPPLPTPNLSSGGGPSLRTRLSQRRAKLKDWGKRVWAAARPAVNLTSSGTGARETQPGNSMNALSSGDVSTNDDGNASVALADAGQEALSADQQSPVMTGQQGNDLGSEIAQSISREITVPPREPVQSHNGSGAVRAKETRSGAVGRRPLRVIYPPMRAQPTKPASRLPTAAQENSKSSHAPGHETLESVIDNTTRTPTGQASDAAEADRSGSESSPAQLDNYPTAPPHQEQAAPHSGEAFSSPTATATPVVNKPETLDGLRPVTEQLSGEQQETELKREERLKTILEVETPSLPTPESPATAELPTESGSI